MSEPATINQLADHLAMLADSVSCAAARIDERAWREPYAPGKWTRIQVLGHLIDSAAHNHQRFAGALHQQSLAAPGYDAGPQVDAQHYAAAPVAVLVETWTGYNRLLAFVLAQIPAAREPTPCTIGPYPPMTLRDLAFDYVAHLEHHLRQIFAASETLPYSGLPWPPQGRWQ